MGIAGKKIFLNHIKGPVGVRGRTSDNSLVYSRLAWKPSNPLIEGLRKMYPWILSQVKKEEVS